MSSKSEVVRDSQLRTLSAKQLVLNGVIHIRDTVALAGATGINVIPLVGFPLAMEIGAGVGTLLTESMRRETELAAIPEKRTIIT